MDPVSAVRRLGGVAYRRELLELVSRRALARAVTEGALTRVGPSQFTLSTADADSIAVRESGGTVSHLSAAVAWGWKVKTLPSELTISVPRHRHPRPRDGVRIVFTTLTPAEIEDGRTSRIRTVLDCARSLPFDEALAVADSALRSGRVDRVELLRAVETSPRTHRAKARRVVEAATADAANPFESVLRAIALDVPGLAVRAQVSVATVGHADVGDAGLRIAIEAESFEFHALPEAFRYDVRRYTEMTRLGWLVARFVWEDVMHRPERVRAVLVDLVRLRAQEESVRDGSASVSA